MVTTTCLRPLLAALMLMIPLCIAFTPTVPSRRSTSLRASSEDDPLRVVIVGGGWAGFSAADALLTSSSRPVDIKLLDASPRGPGGLAGGWRTPKTNRTVEAGLHGFWREYKNTFRAISNIEGLQDLDTVLTPYTPSMLVSESGKVAVAPVLGSAVTSKTTSTIPFLSQLADLLPPPLDIALLSDFNPSSPLTIQDRISAVGLLAAWADFEQESPESWEIYDKISAEQLFLSSSKVTPTLYQELVAPLLHVLPMTPGYDCSAAAALSCFHVFALQTKGAFDVRWCRGSIASEIFNPWSQQLLESENIEIRGSCRMSSMEQHSSGEYVVTVNDDAKIECDAVIFAIGATSMQRLLPTCPPLQKVQNVEWNKMRGITCVAVRLFLEPFGTSDSLLPPQLAKAMEPSPVIVCGPRVLPKVLAETGFCIYDLARLQDDFKGSAALEVDFFRANSLAGMEDGKVIDIALQAVAAALDLDDEIDASLVMDASVVRANNAVSHFCVESASGSPPVYLGEERGLYICGDWIDRTGHASWSTEKAVVTGRQAVAALSDDFGLDCKADILEVAPDSPQLTALRQAAKSIRQVVGGGVPRVPWR